MTFAEYHQMWQQLTAELEMDNDRYERYRRPDPFAQYGEYAEEARLDAKERANDFR